MRFRHWALGTRIYALQYRTNGQYVFENNKLCHLLNDSEQSLVFLTSYYLNILHGKNLTDKKKKMFTKNRIHQNTTKIIFGGTKKNF